MRLTLSQEKLVDLLVGIARIVDRKQVIPVLGHVLLQAYKDSITARGTNLEVEIATQTAATVERTGEITANIQVLFDLVRKFKKGTEVTLDSDGRTLTVKSGRSTTQLPTLPTERFPPALLVPMPSIVGETRYSFSLEASALRGLIEPIESAIAVETTRMFLTGILFHYADEDGGALLRSVATDGYRLGASQWHAPQGSEGMPAIIVPRRAIAELRRLLADSEDYVTVRLSTQKIQFAINDIVLTSKLLEGTYPDYQRTIPQLNDKIIILEKDELAEALDRVSTVGMVRMGVKFELHPDLLKLTVQGLEIGTATEEIPVDYDGVPLVIGFNSKYFRECLASLEGRIEVLLGDSRTPAIIRERGTTHPFFVMMPMRV